MSRVKMNGIAALDIVILHVMKKTYTYNEVTEKCLSAGKASSESMKGVLKVPLA